MQQDLIQCEPETLADQILHLIQQETDKRVEGVVAKINSMLQIMEISKEQAYEDMDDNLAFMVNNWHNNLTKIKNQLTGK